MIFRCYCSEKRDRKMTNTVPKAFFAYPSSAPTLAEPIHEAVRKLNAGGEVEIRTWEECRIAGKVIVNTICEAIDEVQLFFADLTGLNANVMFELGYAIACKKRIWLLLDETYSKEKNMFDRLRILTTVGYVSCCNSRDIVSGFYEDNPVADIENTIFRTAIEPSLQPDSYHSILHLKSQHENEAAMRMSSLLRKKLSNRIIVDDPSETTVHSLAWYGSRVFGCDGLVCHFANPAREGTYLQTARHALVCGMAHGFRKPLLMLAEGDFLAPVDYRDYLKHYATANEALGYLEEWLTPVEQGLKTKQKSTEVPRTAKLAANLKNLRFGEYVAENEVESLVGEYFIETAEYLDALSGRRTVFVAVGRKGSGKTANLIQLENELSKRKQNLVCVIKPQRYQMHEIVALLKRYQHRNVKGNAIESLWKFLLLTEVANTAFNNLENSPSGPVGAVEQSFFNFVEENREIICADFSTRLETCTQNLDRAIGKSNDENFDLPVSETLHSGILKELRVELGKFLSKKQRIAILIDNLDQAWERQNDIEALSEILWGLLDVANHLPVELQRQDSRRQSIQLSLAIFLRSDIFYRIRKTAPEPDKIPYSSLKWNDPELLCRVIEERFLSSYETASNPEVLWNRYFCPTVDDMPTKDYITATILKRPRDIIYLVNAAVTTAINRRHPRIEEEDILAAEKEYSQYALESVNVENPLPHVNLEDVLFEFVGMSAILTRSEVLDTLQEAGISDEEKIEQMIEVLHDLTFLGMEVEEDTFVFSDAPEESRKNKTRARRFARKKGQEERFQIHRAFQAFLETT